MMNHKRGLSNTISCSNNITENLEQRKTPVERRRAKQQTRSSGPNQLKRIALNRGLTPDPRACNHRKQHICQR